MRFIRRHLSTPKTSARRADWSRRGFLGSGLLSLSALAACSSSTPTPTGAPSRPTGQFIEVDGTRLHYRIAGRGPKAIAMHGASGNLQDWFAGPAEIVTRTNQVLFFDRPGMGFSERPARGGDSISGQAALMRKAAAELGFGRAIIIGHSFGGSVALSWIVDAPESAAGAVILPGPSQEWDGGVGLIYGLAANSVTGPLVTNILPSLASDNVIQGAVRRVFAPQSPPAGYLEKVGPDLALKPQNLRANAAHLNGLEAGIRRMVPAYPSLPMPVELLHGTVDQTVPIEVHSEITATQIPRARFTRLNGIGHMPHHAAADQLSQALRRLNRA